MTNAVYAMTVQALSGVVSERAAETMVRTVLRDQQLTPESVTAQDMQRVLSGPLLARLQSVMPRERAQMELRQLSMSMAARYPKAPTLFLEPAPEDRSAAAWATHADDSLTATGWGDVDLGADDFEFDDPEYTASAVKRHFRLDDPAEQEDLIQTLARVVGVQSVLVCRANGEVIKARSLRDSTALGGVVAATALLFQRSALQLLSVDLDGRTVCMRPLGAYCVAVVAGPQVNVGRLLVDLQQLQVVA